MGCGHKIVHRRDMSYGLTYFSGVHVFQADMSYESICLMRAYVLKEVMLCRRKYLVVGHENTT